MAVQASEVPRAVAAAISTASALGLRADEADVLHLSNRLAVRLLPADVLARVALPTHGAAGFEVDLAGRLAATDSPVALLDPRVAPRVHERGGPLFIDLETGCRGPVEFDLAHVPMESATATPVSITRCWTTDAYSSWR